MARRVIILGAQSAIAEAAARRFAAEGSRFVLVGRDLARLNEIAADLRVRGAAACEVEALDLVEARDPRGRMRAWVDTLGGISLVLIAFGVLGDQEEAERDLHALDRLLAVNFNAPAVWAATAAEIMMAQGGGTVMAIGSVAGDRGRQSNYAYGAAKAGIGVFMQGLAHRLAPSGARAVLVKPGFVDTPMTAGFAKGGPLWASPDQIGAAIWRAADKGGPIVYAPWFWRFIMLIIRAVPAFVIHRSKL
ncbi:MAG: SDR family NAD(P)-dependent oxidoreductase [Alphaproteobacteria bacterium]|nr:SDR family NAD(P)-dependent oxidoreductase [Alphaproteobacteria bacterium]